MAEHNVPFLCVFFSCILGGSGFAFFPDLPLTAPRGGGGRAGVGGRGGRHRGPGDGADRAASGVRDLRHHGGVPRHGPPPQGVPHPRLVARWGGGARRWVVRGTLSDGVWISLFPGSHPPHFLSSLFGSVILLCGVYHRVAHTISILVGSPTILGCV